jgi:hypothetical protein
MGFVAGTETTAVAPQPPLIGAYLIDETKLLRIESELRTPEGEGLLEIEDCRTLDRWIWPADQLEQCRLRRVEPARPGRSARHED